MKKQIFNILFFSIIINSNVTLSSLSADKPKQPDFALTTKFFDAVERGNISEVQQLLAQGVSKDIYNNGVGDTALIVATRYQKREMVKFLIEQGFDKNKKNFIGHSPLLIAAQNNDTDGMRDLCCLGTQEIDVHTTDSLKNTPLHIVADKDNYMGVFILLKHGKACSIQKNSFGKTPLHTACAKGALNAVKSLLTYGDKQFELLDNGGRTALYWAIANENYDVAEKLVKENAEIHKGFDWAWYYEGEYLLLVRFVREGNMKAAKKLLAMDIEHQDKWLHAAAWQGHASVVKVLIDAGFKIEHKNSLGYTPLHETAYTSIYPVEAVRVLLAAGVDKNARTKEGETVLHLLVSKIVFWNDDKNFLKILLDAGVDRNIVDNMGRTPQKIAQMRGHFQAVKLLEEYQPRAAAASSLISESKK